MVDTIEERKKTLENDLQYLSDKLNEVVDELKNIDPKKEPEKWAIKDVLKTSYLTNIRKIEAELDAIDEEIGKSK